MRVWSASAAASVLALTFTVACSNPLARQYQYEEQVYLAVDGSATVIVDASIPALVALRGAPFDPSGRSSIDREQVRGFFTASRCGDVRVGQPWTRHGRRFVQIRIETRDVRTMTACAPLAWSTYRFERDAAGIHYEQIVGAAPGRDPGVVNWNGSELIGFKLHAPGRVFFHNVRRLEDGQPGKPDRGNILTWEQHLSDRRAGQPVHLDVRMSGDSILFRTLWLFVGAFTAATTVLLTIIWLVVRRGRLRQAAGGAQG